MTRKFSFLAGLAAGYVLGSAAGRERYEQIKQTAQRVAGNPKVQQTASGLQQNAAQMIGSAKGKVSGKLGEKDMASWRPGRKDRAAAEAPGPVATETPASQKEDAWATATKAEGPVH